MIGRYAIVIMTNRLLVVLIVAAEQNNDGIAAAHKVPKVPSFILAVSVCLPTAAPPGPAGRISAPDTGWTYRKVPPRWIPGSVDACGTSGRLQGTGSLPGGDAGTCRLPGSLGHPNSWR